uniref:Required for meiotic nuclear division 1 homolog n=1 Tax=Eptatretus burgeri TaxID=7764 RepID=A0A8C4QYF8_EPTBU
MSSYLSSGSFMHLTRALSLMRPICIKASSRALNLGNCWIHNINVFAHSRPSFCISNPQTKATQSLVGTFRTNFAKNQLPWDVSQGSRSLFEKVSNRRLPKCSRLLQSVCWRIQGRCFVSTGKVSEMASHVLPKQSQPTPAPTNAKRMRCIAFATSEKYNLHELSKNILSQSGYQLHHLPQDASPVLVVTCDAVENAADDATIFFFQEGAVVFWNVHQTVVHWVLAEVKHMAVHHYPSLLIQGESEDVAYQLAQGPSRLHDGQIQLRVLSEENEYGQTSMLEKFAFSNALSLSVKLAIWESELENFILSIQPVPELLRTGGKVKLTRIDVLRKIGELFTLRHQINLTSDLLITPDFYWDRAELEALYERTCRYLSIPRRVQVMNQKLAQCSDLAQLMNTHLGEKHALRLEAMIVVLISIEFQRRRCKYFLTDDVPSHKLLRTTLSVS